MAMLPPMPPIAAMPASPSYAALAGPMGPAPTAPGVPSEGQTAGAAQIGTGLVKLGMEIDQAMKLLGKMAPSTMEWVLKATQELQQQIGLALQQQTSPLGSPSATFPDGSSRISGLQG